MTAPYWASDDEDVVLHLGDCLDVLRTMEADSIDAIVTDPPAGIAFMGRDWDDFCRARSRFVDMLTERMAEAYRVLKPGGHALVWAIPRTSHWTAWAIEDAGFDLRDCVLHLFGSGFPKSLDVSKAIDKAAGAEREVIGRKTYPDGIPVRFASADSKAEGWKRPWMETEGTTGNAYATAPATEDAARWSGWGTALKPGQEIWWLARKPLAAGTVAANVLEFGTGALNIDGCKVNPGAPVGGGGNGMANVGGIMGPKTGQRPRVEPHDTGRWPANVVFTHSASCGGVCAPDCPVGELDRQSGSVGASAPVRGTEPSAAVESDGVYSGRGRVRGVFHGDTGGASRFYPTFRYQAKAPASERPRLEDGTAHETVKSLGLMSWLVRLITPPGGTVLDLFAGSGPVGEVCVIEGFRCVLIEQNPKSAELIKTRLAKPIQPAMFGLEAS